MNTKYQKMMEHAINIPSFRVLLTHGLLVTLIHHISILNEIYLRNLKRLHQGCLLEVAVPICFLATTVLKTADNLEE